MGEWEEERVRGRDVLKGWTEDWKEGGRDIRRNRVMKGGIGGGRERGREGGMDGGREEWREGSRRMED